LITKSYIEDNLRALERRFQKTSGKQAQFYSKLAIIELCGWIEESMDDVVLRCSVRHLRSHDNRNYCVKQIVQKTYGFDYDNFRFMLIRLLGLVNVERIEARVNQAKLASFKAALSSLKTARNLEAHTHLKGMTHTLNAPSHTLGQLPPVHEGLREFDRVIRSRRW
jgi:hypothetical protein